MAKPIKNKKGFFVLETSQVEIVSAHPLNRGICDRCTKSSFKGYYVAVMNYWMCPACYQSWSDEITTIRYSSDIPYEIEKYNAMCDALGISRWVPNNSDGELRYKGKKTIFMKELIHFCKVNDKVLNNDIKTDIWTQLQYYPSPIYFDLSVAYENATNPNRI